jgi:hypothetical protein
MRKNATPSGDEAKEMPQGDTKQALAKNKVTPTKEHPSF